MSTTPAPAPYGALPCARQLKWHDLEFYGFLHFTTNTFTDLEWGFGDESPAVFNPTDFDADQIVGVAKDAGMKGLILTCKHHDGFCLWPSKYTEHSVKSSTWRDGKGDVVREVADACARHGLKFGVYLSPWDRNHALYGTPEYVEYYRNQLRELLTEYGPIFEVWHDGANGGDGYYGGANEKRTIDKTTYYDWPNTWAIVRELQPEAVIFSDVGPDIRWCGNESGQGNETSWLTLDTTGWCPGFAVTQELNRGHEDGPAWLPPEVDVSIRPGWFYHAREDHRVRSVQQLLDIYYQSVGCSGSWLLNLPPDRRGRIHEVDVDRLKQLRRILDATFAKDFAQGAALSAGNVRGNTAEFVAENVLDGDPRTYWATDDDVTETELILDLGRATLFDRVLIREHIALGQRVKEWAVDVERDGAWQAVAAATTIGYKRILRIPRTQAQRVRIRITNAKACPLISAVGLYLAPRFASEPEMSRAEDGTVAIAVGEGIRLRYTVDGSEPTSGSPLYQDPIALPEGGTVSAAVRAADNPDLLVPGGLVTVIRRFGLAKERWRILSSDSGEDSAPNAVDANPLTHWQSADQPYPHELCIDLGAEVTATAFGYLPRQQARNAAGIVERYEVFLSSDQSNWSEPAAAGRFDNIQNNPIQQIVEFAEPKTGRYLRFLAAAASDGRDLATAAEIDLFVD